MWNLAEKSCPAVHPAFVYSPALTSLSTPTTVDRVITLPKDLAREAFSLLSAEELTEIAKRADERRATAPEPWASVYETIYTLAHASLAGKLSDPG